MAAQEYIIKSLKKKSSWKGSYGDFQDYAIQLEGIGEPVKLSLPLPIIEDPEVGDRLFGRLYEEKGSNGLPYYKLKLETRPEEDLRTIDIHAQVGTKLAVQLWGSTDYESEEDRLKAYANIAQEALHFARIIDDVKKELLK
jgi:hypothetical protein